jgi:hypothetical protein
MTDRELKYLISRSNSAERAYRVAKEQRLGATVIKRRFGAWAVSRAKLEEALSRAGKKAA